MRTAFVIPLLLLFLGLVSAASDWLINNPVGTTTWTSGQDQKITWILLTSKDKGFNAAAPDVTQVNIDLMQGQFENADIVAHITTGISVQALTYTWANVPDYAQGNDYFVRVGTDKWWRYTHAFTFNGKGTVKSLGQPAPQPSAAPSPDASGNSTTPGSNSTAGTGGATTGGANSTSTTTSTTASSAAASATNKPSSNSNSASFAVTNASATLLTVILTVICVAFNY